MTPRSVRRSTPARGDRAIAGGHRPSHRRAAVAPDGGAEHAAGGGQPPARLDRLAHPSWSAIRASTRRRAGGATSRHGALPCGCARLARIVQDSSRHRRVEVVIARTYKRSTSCFHACKMPTKNECLKSLCDYRPNNDAVSASDLRKWRMNSHPDKGGSNDDFRYANDCYELLHPKLQDGDIQCSVEKWYYDEYVNHALNTFIPYPRYGSICKTKEKTGTDTYVLSADKQWSLETGFYSYGETRPASLEEIDRYDSERISMMRNDSLRRLLEAGSWTSYGGNTADTEADFLLSDEGEMLVLGVMHHSMKPARWLLNNMDMFMNGSWIFLVEGMGQYNSGATIPNASDLKNHPVEIQIAGAIASMFGIPVANPLPDPVIELSSGTVRERAALLMKIAKGDPKVASKLIKETDPDAFELKRMIYIMAFKDWKDLALAKADLASASTLFERRVAESNNKLINYIHRVPRGTRVGTVREITCKRITQSKQCAHWYVGERRALRGEPSRGPQLSSICRNLGRGRAGASSSPPSRRNKTPRVRVMCKTHVKVDRLWLHTRARRHCRRRRPPAVPSPRGDGHKRLSRSSHRTCFKGHGTRRAC